MKPYKKTPSTPVKPAVENGLPPGGADGAKEKPRSAEVAHQPGVTSEPPRPSPSEVATLAALIAINYNIQHPSVARAPKDFLAEAYTLLSDAERLEPYQVIAEAFNKMDRTHRDGGDALHRNYSLKEVLEVQKAARGGASSLLRLVGGVSAEKPTGRLKFNNEFGQGFFHHDDLVNRPAGISMVGSIGTVKGLRKALKRVFSAEEGKHIMDRQTLTLLEINKLLKDELRIYRGRIPMVRAAKSSPP